MVARAVQAPESRQGHRLSSTQTLTWLQFHDQVIVEKGKSLGNVERSVSNTLYPFRARSKAVGDPAHRAPTTIASYIDFSPTSDANFAEPTGQVLSSPP
jgi:hypothetical protein